jgi:DNA-binding NarL/FixJ family response regulator
VTRVLVGPFAALLRAGVDDLLGDPRIAVIHTEVGEDFFARLVAELPDVVLLDLEAPDSVELADRISRAFPALTVVACSSVDPTMRIFPRFHHGESYTSPVASASFTAALST